MRVVNRSRILKTDNSERQWESIYLLGGITTIMVLIGIVIDIGFGSASGGNLSILPQTAIERFEQFQQSWALGLYNLDLLNVVTQLLMVPGFFSLYAAHRYGKNAYALLGLIIFIIGTSIFVTNNTALPMLDLSRKYTAATSDFQKTLLAAAGEAMLVRGSHGSLSSFIGFLLPSIAELVMSIAMLSGKVFRKVNSYFGIVGSFLMMAYIILITFVPAVESTATLIAMPGGLCLTTWMILFTVRLFKLAKQKVSG